MPMRKRLGVIAGTLLSVVLLVASTGPAAAAQPTDQQVRKLMDTIGLGRSLSQMNIQIATSMKQSLPCVASNYWQDFVDQAGSNEFISRLVPIYQKHFTADEVDGMVKFYSSPLGQKVLTEMPAAMAEASEVGQHWSQEHGQEMIVKLEQAGTLTMDGRCPAAVGAKEATTSPSESSGDAALNDDEATAPPVVTHGHSRARASHKHVPVKKKAARKKSGSNKSSSSKTGTKKAADGKSAPAKSASSKAPAKAKVRHPSTADKPAATGASGT